MLVSNWKARLWACSLTLQETGGAQYQLQMILFLTMEMCACFAKHRDTHTHTQPQTNTRTPANPAWQNPGAKNNMRWRTDYCGSNLWKALNKTHLKWLLRCYFHELAQRTLHVLPVPVFTFQQTMTALTFLLAVILDSHMEKRCNCFVYWE